MNTYTPFYTTPITHKMAHTLPYGLSIEDGELFSSLVSSALLHQVSTPGSGEFAQRFRDRKLAEERDRLHPYTDLLEAEIRRQITSRDPESLLDEMRACHVYDMGINLFSWNTIFFNESLLMMKERVAEMSPSEQMEHRYKKQERDISIEQQGYCHTIGVNNRLSYGSNYHYYDCGDEYDGLSFLSPVKIHRIFTKTDLAKRLTLILGPNFFPSFRYEQLAQVNEEGTDGYLAYKVTLFAKYYPSGLPRTQMKELLDVARTQQRRQAEGKVRTLSDTEWLVGIGEWRKGSHNVNSVSLLGTSPSPCHCGYHWKSGEESE